MKFIENRKWAF